MKDSLQELREELCGIIARFCTEPFHRDTTMRALSRPGYALHEESSCRAGLFTLEVYRSISGATGKLPLRASASIELVMEAGFMFDAVADHDTDPRHVVSLSNPYGLTPSEELALAITVLSCGVSAAHETAYMALGQELAMKSFLQLQASCIAACGGQFLDAYLQKSEYATSDESLKMTCMKSGSLGKLAAEFGAALAASDEAIVQLFGEFGYNLFTYFQLVDDLRDALPESGPAADMSQGKKTLPLVYFYNALAEAHPNDINAIMRQDFESLGLDVRQKFNGSGVWSFCFIVAEAFLNRAKANLSDLKRHMKAEGNLERLVSSLEISPNRFPTAT